MTSASDRESLQMYELALVRLNKYFQVYNQPDGGCTPRKMLHFTSQQLRNFPNLLNFYQNGPEFSSNSRQVAPDQFEEFFNNVQLLKDLKVSCSGEFIAELQHFRSLERVHIVGPCLNSVKGLRAVSTNLHTLIAEKGTITLHELLSSCCMDESGPMSWPKLLCLEVSECFLTSLDSSLKLLPNLQELDLSFNRISSIGNELCYLDRLTHLNLSYNRLPEIPQLLGRIRWRLQYLYLSYNEISTCEGLETLESLIELNISNNLLIQHDTLVPLRRLSKLQKLDLRGNPLSFNKNHRFLSLQSISPESVKPEFLLDGMLLSKKDLKDVMYTPMAVSVQPYPSNHEFMSINTAEPELYDVSMSSAAVFTRRRTEGDLIHKFSSLKNKRMPGSTSKLNTNDDIFEPDASDELTDEEMPSMDFDPPNSFTVEKKTSVSDNSDGTSSNGTPRDFDQDSDALSMGSAISQNSVSDLQISHVSLSRSPASCQDEKESSKLTGNSDEYASPVDEYNVYDESSSYKNGDDSNNLFTSATNDSKTSGTSTLTTIDNGEIELVTLPLHVKRSVTNELDTETILSGPSEVYLAATHNHLIEKDIETGKLWEELELSTISDVSLNLNQKMPVIDLKFTYLRKNRRTRRYVVLDIGANEAIELLYRELESVAFRNREVKNRSYICLKCSKHFTLGPGQNLPPGKDVSDDTKSSNILGAMKKSQSDQSKSSGILCSCGSDKVVEKEIYANTNNLITVNEDECQEATEYVAEVTRSQNIPRKDLHRSASIDVGRTLGGVDASLSWIHTLQSVPDASSGFHERQHMHVTENERHLSGSLPTDLSSVLMQTKDNLENAVSVPTVDMSHQAQTPFKTFSHLLTTHDLYKLINVTPSIVTMNSKNFTQYDQQTHDVSENVRFTPQPRDNHTSAMSSIPSHKKMIVTSTPRRKPNRLTTDNVPLSVGHNPVIRDDGASIIVRDAKRRRGLNFEGSESKHKIDSLTMEDLAGLPVEYYEFDEANESKSFESCVFKISTKLKRFIEEELLEAEEEICSIVQTRLIRERGKVLNTTVSNTPPRVTGSGKKRGLFGSAKKKKMTSPTQGVSTLSQEISPPNEIDVLLLLTTKNIQILQITDTKVEIGPETLECLSSYHLNQILGIDLGLSNCALYFAVTGNDSDDSDIKSEFSPRNTSGKKFGFENIEQIYAVHFRDTEKCERFYQCWMMLYDARQNINSLSASLHSNHSSASNNQPNSVLIPPVNGDCMSAFSDALEKNFSEHVLMSLDLSILEPKVKKTEVESNDFSNKLLTDKLFVYKPCWLFDVNIGKEVPVGVVISCGGSLSLVIEESSLIMFEFASALVQAKRSKAKHVSRSNSFSSDVSLRNQSVMSPLQQINHSDLNSLSRQVYVKKISTKCSEIKSIVRYKDHPLCLELNFAESAVPENIFLTWQLNFSSPFSLLDTEEILRAYFEAEKGSDITANWK
uniref:serine/threonine-protein kinase 11-interacting protein-like n=1 Tax=Styela clava TaxID=7725 RepID=UPI00193A3507|nr:serine/threonine-protein kinase 11-interacting protein-like [Styela clava]